jgi:Flp pilus assembly protein TadG
MALIILQYIKLYMRKEFILDDSGAELQGRSMIAKKSPSCALRRLARDEKGASLLMFALAIIPVMLAVGAAIDYGRSASIKNALNAAADTAALTAAKVAAEQIAANNSSWQAAAVTAAQNVFVGNAQSIGGLAAAPAPSVSLSQSGASVVAQLSFSVQVATTVMRVGGISTLNVANTVTATISTPLQNYTDLHIVIDTSASMGLGASSSDQAALSQPTVLGGIGCALACHFTDDVGDTDNLAAARAVYNPATGTNVQLRIDAVKAAIVNALTAVQNANSTVELAKLRIAVYTFSNALANVYPLQTGVSGAIAAVDAVDLAVSAPCSGGGSGCAVTGGAGGTNISYSLQQLAATLAAAGDGSSSTSPLGYVLLVTDGVQDSTYDYQATSGSSTNTPTVDPNWVAYPTSGYTAAFPGFVGDPIVEPVDPSQCSAITSAAGLNYKLMTMNVNYVVPTGADLSQSPADVPRFSFIAYLLGMGRRRRRRPARP